jgi:hypothetical protein
MSMNRSFLRRAATAIAAGAGVIALATSLPATAATAHHPGRPVQHHPVRRAVGAPVVVNCEHRAVIAPRTFILTCADANDYLAGLRWVSWRTEAFGTGVEHINTCNPNCAAGHFRRYRALITLWRPRHLRRGLLEFTRLTEVYPGARPVRYDRHGHKYHPLTYTWSL